MSRTLLLLSFFLLLYQKTRIAALYVIGSACYRINCELLSDNVQAIWLALEIQGKQLIITGSILRIIQSSRKVKVDLE